MIKRKAPPSMDRLKELYHCNPITGIFIHKKTSRQSKRGVIAGGLTSDGYITVGIDGIGYRAHRLIWYYVHGTWPPEIDHKNRVKTDNRIDNLRIATTSQNQMNSDRTGSKKSKLPRGVHVHRGRYQSVITVDGKMKHLGCFYSIKEAALAYEEAARKHFGEFAP